MIPNSSISSIQEVRYPSKTYRLDFDNKRISGDIDNHEAIVQAVRKLISTEKYSYVIYTDYGIELDSLLVQDFEFIQSDIERRLIEALSIDDRIIGISDLIVTEIKKDSISISFNVDTIEGKVNFSDIII